MFTPGALRFGVVVLGCAALIVVLGGCPTSTPTVSSTYPSDGAIGAPVNTQIAAIFSEAMDPATITAETFTLHQGTTLVSGTVTYESVTAIFNPTSELAPNTLYTARITTAAEALNKMRKCGGCPDELPVVSAHDGNGLWVIPALVAGILAVGIAGNAIASSRGNGSLAEDFVWTFTTGALPDTTAPWVSSTVPANRATGVPRSGNLTAAFSEAMDPSTINTATFTLDQGTTPVSGTVTHVNLTATFIPASDLAPNALYTATITTGAEDLAGNRLASDHVWTFTTGVTFTKDYFTQEYTAGVDLGFKSLTFTPDNSFNFFDAAMNDPVTAFLTTPAAGDNITSLFAQTDPVERSTSGISFYGVEYDSFFVGSSGIISFGANAENASADTLAQHFAVPQISALSTMDARAGGKVSITTTSTRVAVTYENVPAVGKAAGDIVNVQVELFFDGTIRLTYLDVIASSGIVGLSNGPGTTPADFVPSDLTSYNTSGGKTAP